jgi:hypothetical protein
MSTLLNVEIHPHVHTAGGGKVNTLTVNAGMPEKNLIQHRHFRQYSTESVWHQYSSILVSPVPMVTD